VPPRRADRVRSRELDIIKQRDRHIAYRQTHGKRAWRAATGYTRRNLIEAGVSRYKRIIGRGISHPYQNGRGSVASEKAAGERGKKGPKWLRSPSPRFGSISRKAGILRGSGRRLPPEKECPDTASWRRERSATRNILHFRAHPRGGCCKGRDLSAGRGSPAGPYGA
jgi:hypothetical protein